MERKLVQQGNNALTVTLPSTWLKKYNLKAKDVVELEEAGRAIMVTTKRQFEAEEYYGSFCPAFAL